MALEAKLMTDLKEALKAKDQGRMRSIRAIKAAILLLKTDGSGNEVTEEMEIKLLQKLIKQRKESLDIYKQQNREDLAAVEQEEIKWIETYLPEQLSPEEIKETINNIITETGASGMKDMGRVMGMASKTFAGKADNKTVANLVKELLSSK